MTFALDAITHISTTTAASTPRSATSRQPSTRPTGTVNKTSPSRQETHNPHCTKPGALQNSSTIKRHNHPSAKRGDAQKAKPGNGVHPRMLTNTPTETGGEPAIIALSVHRGRNGHLRLGRVASSKLHTPSFAQIGTAQGIRSKR